MTALVIRNLSVEFSSSKGVFRAVDGFDLDVASAESVGLVGESGSGKSTAMLAVMGLLPSFARVRADELRFGDIDLRNASPRKRRKALGSAISMIFQDPLSSLNPCFTIGWQITDVLKLNRTVPSEKIRDRVLELLALVGIPSPEQRYHAYPHQLSGGLCQRVMIAMALAGEPKLLIADEPTTALDVTVQKQILDLLCDLQKKRQMSLMLITHDMGVVAKMAQRVYVMYGGFSVEEGKTRDVLERPRHPYAAALLRSMPEAAIGKARLPMIPGMVASGPDLPPGCLFAPRCERANEVCNGEMPPMEHGPDRGVRCYDPLLEPFRPLEGKS
ncbi:ABC transporter ATP-binding protein [Rhizobium sp. Root482]|uniref:ABC transporter ATP-binding protein n=1 Tax=Rhizobium sp. Root482 TaxID=1736543 RepID=UPI0006FFC9F4|nr:ABC transporter ATP-binding protein [Rhizobium sp. Root482]KQY19149.1 peptide ABC transporter ATP-binding protein [Rhizobium sp. Root482]